MGDKLHLKLNINEIPIAHKYREGKMKRTLKRELKGTEIAEKEVERFNGLVKSSHVLWIFSYHSVHVRFCGDSGSDCTKLITLLIGSILGPCL